MCSLRGCAVSISRWLRLATKRANRIKLALALSRNESSGGSCGGFALPRRRQGGEQISLSTPPHDWALGGRLPGVAVVAGVGRLLVSGLGWVAGPLGVGVGGFVRVGGAARG